MFSKEQSVLSQVIRNSKGQNIRKGKKLITAGVTKIKYSLQKSRVFKMNLNPRVYRRKKHKSCFLSMSFYAFSSRSQLQRPMELFWREIGQLFGISLVVRSDKYSEMNTMKYLALCEME